MNIKNKLYKSLIATGYDKSAAINAIDAASNIIENGRFILIYPDHYLTFTNGEKPELIENNYKRDWRTLREYGL